MCIIFTDNAHLPSRAREPVSLSSTMGIAHLVLVGSLNFAQPINEGVASLATRIFISV